MIPLAALAAHASAPTPTGSAGARIGTTLASNLDHATDTAEAANGVAWRVSADGTVGLRSGVWWGGLSVQVGYVGWPAWPTLSGANLGLALPLSWTPTPRVGVGLMPRLTARWVADEARSALGPGIGGWAKVRITRPWSARTSLSYTWVPATEAVFDERTLRWGLGTELHPWKMTWLYAEVGLSGGPTVVYLPVTTTTPTAKKDGDGDGQGTGKKPTPDPIPDETFGTDLVATQVQGYGPDLTLEVEQGFTDWSFVRARGGFSRWIVDPGPFDVWTLTLELGVRTP